MTMNRSAVIITIQTVVIVLLAWALVFYARDEWKIGKDSEDDHVKTESRASVEEGRPTVKLSEQAQAASGIVTEPLKSTSAAPESKGYGSVVNLQPLIELRSRYLTARTDAASARASLANTNAEYQRLSTLLRDDRNVSQRAVQAAEAAWKADQVRVTAAEQLAASTLDSMKNQWGNTLAGWAIEPDSKLFGRLMSRDDVIVQVAISNGLSNPGAARVSVSPVESNAKLRAAQFVSASPQTDATLQGQTFFYRVTGDGLRIGMRLTAQIRTEGKSIQGVAVPNRAVIWYAGKAWVYIKSGDNDFVRHEISARQESGESWIVTSGLSVDTEVVVSGAQLLLSEELKYQLKTDD